MDSGRLREEQSELLKSVSELKHRLEIGDKRIKDLHEEEMTYLKEIPIYKNQAQEAKDSHAKIDKNTQSLKASLEQVNKELLRVKELVAQENRNLDNLKLTQSKIIQETKDINDQIKQRHNDLKLKEEDIAYREKECRNKEDAHKLLDSELNKREVDVEKGEKEYSDKVEELNSDIDMHGSNVASHAEQVRSLAEQRKFHEEDSQLLKEKLQKADRLVREQIDLKAALILQAEKLSREVQSAQSKQIALDRALADLVNQENAFKIKELRLKKLAHDAGLVKELAELSK